jgi:methylase of polypeptide subunit release factors
MEAGSRVPERTLFGETGPRSLITTATPEWFYSEKLRSARNTAEILGLSPREIEELIRWLLPVIGRCTPEDDPVGWIHAHAQRNRLLRGPGQRLRFQVDRQRGRSHGVLYTPPLLTEALVGAVLGQWIKPLGAGGSSLFGGGDHRRSPDAARVLDPACGSGQFLLSIVRRLIGENVTTLPERKPEEVIDIFTSMHGVDIDPEAASLAAFNLSLQAVRALSRTQKADTAAVVPWLQERLGPGFPWFLERQIHHGNALHLAAGRGSPTFRWTEKFAGIFEGERPGFDIVIGNPPWVSYGLRDRAGAEEEESAYLRGLFTFGAQYKLSLYPLFIELALRLTRPGGYHGFLVPDSFFTGRHFSKIRKHILETSRPLLFCLVESGPWPGVHVGHTAFYCLRRLPAPETPRTVITTAIQLPPYTRRSRKMSASLPLFREEAEDQRPVEVSTDLFERTPHHAFRIFRNEQEREFVDRLERSPCRFEDLIETYSGLIARHGQEGVLGPRPVPFIIRDRQGRIVVQDPDPRQRWKCALHSGSEVEPFRTRWRSGSLYIPDERETLRAVYKSGFDLDKYAGEKVFLRQTGDRLVAAREATGLLCLNNVHLLRSRKEAGIDARFLCAILMSRTIQRYYQVIAMEAGRPLAQVDLVTIQTLPWPCDLNGVPFGRAVPRQAFARTARQVRDMLRAGRGEELRNLLLNETSSRESRKSENETPTQTEAACLVLSEAVEVLERSEDEKARRHAREILDDVIELLFALRDPSGIDAERTL